MRSGLKISFLVCVSIFILVQVFGQDKKLGIISGKVQDASTKEPLIDAVVTLSSDVFEGQKFAVTDSSGKYRIDNLPKGIYTISFEMEGYKKYTHENIKLSNGMSLGVSFQMAKVRKSKVD